MDDEALKQENPELYRVARKKGTELPFSGKYVHTKDDGMYHCAVCDAPLFSSKQKFDSSAWPAFTDPAFKDAIKLVPDNSYGMERTEVLCTKCGAHLGHVFPKSHKENGKVCDHYCINSVSLNFKNE